MTSEHTVKSFDEELTQLTNTISRMGGLAEAQISGAIQAIIRRDAELATTVVETDHPQAGRLRQARPAARFSKTPPGIRSGGPRLGEHTREILQALGYGGADIEALRAAGVIGMPEARA